MSASSWEALPWERDAGGTDWNVWGPKGSNHLGNDNLQGDYGSEADARLIAAAPDLLAALTELMSANSYYFPVGNPWGDKARAAIAKATTP